MMAVPGALAVTFPFFPLTATVATAVLLEVHVPPSNAMVRSAVTVGVSVSLAPTLRSFDDGESVTPVHWVAFTVMDMPV